MQSRPPPPWSWTVLVAMAVLVAQGIALLNPDFVVVDCEERFNAAHGVALAQGHWDALFELQYRKFCGGCTLDAALAGVLFSVLPTTFGVWKLVPLGFSLAIATVGFRGLWRLSGPLAAALFAGFVVLAPGTWVRLALLGWGNHYEAGLYCLALGLWAARPPSDRAHAGVGLLAGLAMWFGFSSTFAVLGLLGWLGIRRRFRALAFTLGGLTLAPALWAVQLVSTHQHPFGTIYSDGEAVPSLWRVPFKLKTLLLPRQLAGLFGIPRLSVGIPVGVSAALALVVAWVDALRTGRTRGGRIPEEAVFASVLAIWLALYLVVDFRLELRDGEGVPSAAGLRYAAPWMPLAWALLSLTAARWWSVGRRAAAGLLVLPFVVSGVLTKVAVLGGAFPNAFVLTLDAPDHENYRFVHSYALDPRDHPVCPGSDPDHLAAHAFAAGRHSTLGVLGADADLSRLPTPVEPVAAYYAGVGQALVDHTDSDAVGGLSTLEDVVGVVAVLPEPGRQPALAEATWWRAYRDEPYGFARGAAGSASALTRLLTAARTVDPALRDSALHSLGRRWGLVLGRWGQVGTVSFPAIRRRAADDAGLRAFARGLGHGLGTKWGPADVVPRPRGMPVDLDDAYLAGVAAGIGSQWTVDAVPVIGDTSASGAPWIDVGAERWWGPAPTMYCPCRASCW